jgi:hypothetical protein
LFGAGFQMLSYWKPWSSSRICQRRDRRNRLVCSVLRGEWSKSFCVARIRTIIASCRRTLTNVCQNVL